MAKPSKTKASTRTRRPRRAPPKAAVPASVITADAAEVPIEFPSDISEQAPAGEPVTVDETSAPADRVSLGPVEVRMKRLPTKVVLGLLSPEGLRRVDAQDRSGTFEATCKRMLATDGRATPIVFEDGKSPSLLHGYEELKAAVDLGLAAVSVLLVPAGGADEAQAHIVEMVRQQRMAKQTSQDDELFYRVHAED